MKVLKFTYRLFPNWIRNITKCVPDSRVKAKCDYSMEQVVFCGLMIFLLRYRSLRSFFMENRDNPRSLKNFQEWITIHGIPSDDQLRYCLQTVSTRSLNELLQSFHQTVERKKILKDEKFLGKHELVIIDGTGHLSSKKIHCEKCLLKTRQSGEVIHHHGQLLASLTNSKGSYALPLQFEPIERDDVDTQYTKNDCELNAGKRLITKMKSQFPKRNFCFLGDNLFAAEPFVDMILAKGWHFILTAKPDKNKELFFMFEYLKEQRQSLNRMDSCGVVREYRWSNKLPLKQYKNGIGHHVNLVEYVEIASDGRLIYKNSWITDFEITANNVQKIAQAGRARFAIENRNFNEQKNLGFQTEHNFGHFGNLPNVFFGLAQIAHLITELFCYWKSGKDDIESVGSKRRYFERLAVIIGECILDYDPKPILYLKFDFNSNSS